MSLLKFISSNRILSGVHSKTHFLDLIFDFGFMVLLFSYVVRPPEWPGPALTCLNSARETCIVIYAFSTLISARGTNVILSAVTLAAFTLSPATLPKPGELRFYALLCVIFFRLFMYLVLAILPNPTLLVQHRRSFPPVVFLSQGLIRIVRPLICFYLPIIVASFLTFSISMSEPLTGSLTYLQAISGFDLPVIGIAPMDTRRIFLLFSMIVWLIVLLSGYILGFSTSMASSDPLIFSPSTAWDRYTPEIGHIARIRSYRAIIAYVDDYPFPPPFNIVELLLVTIPIGLIRLLVNSRLRRATIARPVWNITVRPLMMIVAPFCVFLA